MSGRIIESFCIFNIGCSLLAWFGVVMKFQLTNSLNIFKASEAIGNGKVELEALLVCIVEKEVSASNRPPRFEHGEIEEMLQLFLE